MTFPPPRFPKTLPKAITPTKSSVLSFKEFFGGGIIRSREAQAYSPQTIVHPTLSLLTPPPPVHKTSYRITWTDFERQLSDKFAEMYRSADSTDVSIMCGINFEILRAHQLVLSMGSLYFRDALKLVPSKHPTVVVRNLTGNNMRKILDYMYLGQTSFRTETELNSFIDEAKYLQVVGIENGKYSVTL